MSTSKQTLTWLLARLRFQFQAQLTMEGITETKVGILGFAEMESERQVILSQSTGCWPSEVEPALGNE